MKFKIVWMIPLVPLFFGCAAKKAKERHIQVAIEQNVISCRFIGTVTGKSSGDALDQAAALDSATHLVWTGKAEGRVYSCD